MRVTETIEDLLHSDAALEVRRRGGEVVRAARGLPGEAPRSASRLFGVGLFAGGLLAGLGIGFVARRLFTPVPTVGGAETVPPAYPVKDGVVDLTAVADVDGIPAADVGVTDAAPGPVY